VVRENPLFHERIAELRQFQVEMGVAVEATLAKRGRGQRVRALGTTFLELHVHFFPVASFF
jgi:hypothetical protein